MKCGYCKTEHDLSYCPRCGNFEGKKSPIPCPEEEVIALMQGMSEYCEGDLFTIEAAYHLSRCTDALQDLQRPDRPEVVSFLRKQLNIYRDRYADAFNGILIGSPYVKQELSFKHIRSKDESRDIKEDRKKGPDKDTQDDKLSGSRIKRNGSKKDNRPFPSDEDPIPIDLLIGRERKRPPAKTKPAGQKNDALKTNDPKDAVSFLSPKISTEPIVLHGSMSDPSAEMGKIDEGIPGRGNEIGAQKSPDGSKEEKKDLQDKEKRSKKGKGKTKKKGKRKVVIADPEGDADYDGYYDDVPVIGEVERSFEQIVVSENAGTLIGLGAALLIGLAFIIYGIMSIF